MSHPSVTMASWVRLCHDPRDAPEAPVLLLVVTRLQSLVTTGPVTRCTREGVSVSAADVSRYSGETAELSVWEQCQLSVIHPR